MNQSHHCGGSAPDQAFRNSDDFRGLGTHRGSSFLRVCRLAVGLVGADPGSGSLERKADFMGAGERSLRPGESTIAASSHHRSRPMVITCGARPSFNQNSLAEVPVMEP